MLILVQADLLARIVSNTIIHHRSPTDQLGVLIALACIMATRAAMKWLQQVMADRAAAAVKGSLRRQLLSHTQQLGPGWLAGQQTGAVTTTLGRGLDALDPYFTGYLPQLFVAAVVPAVVVARLFSADLASAATVCVTLPLIPILGILLGLHAKRSARRQWQALEQLGGHFLDNVAGLPTARAFGRAATQAATVRRRAEDHRLATMRTLRAAFLSAVVLELVATVSVALIAVPIGLHLLNGELDLYTAVLILLLAPEAYLPLRLVGSQFHASTEGLAVAERVFAVLDVAAEPADRRVAAGGSAAPQASAAHEVTFDKVSVQYAGRELSALIDVSLTIDPGEHVALVGRSGAGKSTLLAVLLGLVRPTSGRVVVMSSGGPCDLADVDMQDWRQQVAWVPQRPYLFARSVAANIRLGRPTATEEEVRQAAMLAHADDFVQQLPHGYDTSLGEGGTGLSTGQRQRIALARAFLRDAPLLLLDEPTAGLDAISEERVVDATTRLMVGRTVLVVAHRPAMTLTADRIVRLDSGVVANDTQPSVALLS